MHACVWGLEERVVILLSSRDIQVNLVDKEGQSALMLAVLKYPAIVRLLLARDDIDVNLVDRDGRSALMLCAHRLFCAPMLPRICLEGGFDLRLYGGDIARILCLDRHEQGRALGREG